MPEADCVHGGAPARRRDLGLSTLCFSIALSVMKRGIHDTNFF